MTEPTNHSSESTPEKVPVPPALAEIPTVTPDTLVPAPSPQQRTLGEMSKEEIKALIKGMHPLEELRAGMYLLELILERDGPKGLEEFGKKFGAILDKESDLTPSDFVGYEELLRKAGPSSISGPTFMHGLMNFLETWGCSISGVAFTLWGVFGGLEQLADFAAMAAGEEPAPVHRHVVEGAFSAWKIFFAEIKEKIESSIYPAAEMLIGAVLILEHKVHWDDIKEDNLKQIQNAIADLATIIDKLESHSQIHPPQPIGRGFGMV